MTLTVGELFAGVGGFSLGFEAAGFRTMWQVEIDKWCQQVLARHWPEAARYGDVTGVHACTCRGRSVQPHDHGDHDDDPAGGVAGVGGQHPGGLLCRCGGLAPVDVITFGSPCQDMSVAGKRAGLDGARSNLFYEATRIITEMREATDGRCPAWAVWENVPGALSSDSGNDFACVLDALAECGAVDLQWRVLDARFCGVPQRRRRVFVVAGFDPRVAGRLSLFPVGPGGDGGAAPGEAAGEDLAGTLGGGFAGGWPGDLDRMTFIPSTPTLTVGEMPCREGGTELEVGEADVYNSLRAADGGSSRQNLVAYNPYRTQTAPGEVEGFEPDELVDAITASTPPNGRPVAVQPADEIVYQCQGTNVGPLGSLRRGNGNETGGVPFTPIDLAVRRLTPRECERLMGWPDDHTRWTADGPEIGDGHRYRMCGNGVVAPVAEWLAGRLLAALEDLPEGLLGDAQGGTDLGAAHA